MQLIRDLGLAKVVGISQSPRRSRKQLRRVSVSKQQTGESGLRTKHGFSLIELMILVSFLAIVSGFSMMIIGPALKARNVEMAMRTVSLQMSRARQYSVDARRLTRVTFTAPSTITVHQQAPVAEGGAWTQVSEAELPGEMEFNIDAGISSGPEGFTTSQAINFSGLSQVFFMPDGSAITGIGQISNGVAYLSWPQEVDTTRAVTLFGGTGRVKRWKYVYESGSWE